MKYIVDTTLRDGEQAPGVVFSLEEKMVIAGLLDEIGIDELEIGTPAISKEEREHIRQIVQQGFRFKTSCWCRANIDDIRHAATTGTSNVNISFPVSEILLISMGKDQRWVMKTLPEIIKLAGDAFGFVTIGAQDASRADPTFLAEYIHAAVDNDANRIRIADTVGIVNPVSVQELFVNLIKHFPSTDFEFHAHNDLGMATANAVTALHSGASGISGTVNGLGERAGNAALEEVIMAWKVSGNKEVRYNTQKLHELCRFVALFSGKPIPDSKPISGKMAFTHESGIHCSSLLKDKLSYQCFLPEEIGTGMKLCYGKHSGRSQIVYFFTQFDIRLDEWQVEWVIEKLKLDARRLKRALTENELLDIYLELNSKPVY